MSDNEHPPGSLLAKDTTPTWEMELLISGVTVFALLQLAGLLDQAYLALRPKLDVDWDSLTRLLFAYSKMSVLTLAVAFVLHLILRAHWIALVGMNSIYPDGVRWDRLKIGAIKQRLIEQRGITLVNRIEAADNRSSIVFALGVTFALTLACLALLVSLGFAISALLVRLLDWPWLMPRRTGTFRLVPPMFSCFFSAAKNGFFWYTSSFIASGAKRCLSAAVAAVRSSSVAMLLSFGAHPSVRGGR